MRRSAHKGRKFTEWKLIKEERQQWLPNYKRRSRGLGHPASAAAAAEGTTTTMVGSNERTFYILTVTAMFTFVALVPG